MVRLFLCPTSSPLVRKKIRVAAERTPFRPSSLPSAPSNPGPGGVATVAAGGADTASAPVIHSLKSERDIGAVLDALGPRILDLYKEFRAANERRGSPMSANPRTLNHKPSECKLCDAYYAEGKEEASDDEGEKGAKGAKSESKKR
jgi:hypothetical protein